VTGRARVPPDSGIELVWPGKYDDQGRRVEVAARRTSWIERERHGPDGAPADELVRGDNLDVLDRWLETRAGSVDLVVIDPPFSTGTRFDVLTRIGDGDDIAQAPAYADRWPGGASEFLAMLAPRLARIHALLAAHGSLYVHVDPTVGHAVKLLLDEVFGPASFQREIVWRIGWVSGFKTRAKNWIRNHDLIFFYVKDPARIRFNKVYVPHPPGYQRRAGAPAKAPGIAIDDVWNAGPADLALAGRDSLDSIQIKSFSNEKTGYATQKNEALLRRIIAASSEPGDWIADPFCGSGTTLAVAAAMGRRFLGCDCGRAAFQIARTRLLGVPRTWPLVIGEVEPARTRAKDVRTRVLSRWGARPLARAGDLHGERDGAAVHVADGTPIDRAQLERLATLARERRLSALHVLSRSVALALDVSAEGDARRAATPKQWVAGVPFDVTLAVLDPDALASDDGADATHVLPERPVLAIEVRGLGGSRPTIELTQFAAAHPASWPADLRSHLQSGRALVESIAIAWRFGDTAVRFTDVRTRTPSKRALDLAFALPSTLPPIFTAIVQIVDVRRVETSVELSFGPALWGPELLAARMR
jgi:DNA modification methylase